MDIKIIEGVIALDEDCGIWSFKSEGKAYSDVVCEAIDQMLDNTTHEREKYRITIEKL